MFETTFAPRFYETDALGHVNNTVVTGWFEAAREPVFRIFSPTMDVKNWRLILARVEVDFVAQIHFGDAVTVCTLIEKIGNSSFTVGHEAFQNGQLVARGKAVMVHFDFTSQKSVLIPDTERSALAQHMVAA